MVNTLLPRKTTAGDRNDNVQQNLCGSWEEKTRVSSEFKKERYERWQQMMYAPTYDVKRSLKKLQPVRFRMNQEQNKRRANVVCFNIRCETTLRNTIRLFQDEPEANVKETRNKSNDDVCSNIRCETQLGKKNQPVRFRMNQEQKKQPSKAAFQRSNNVRNQKQTRTLAPMMRPSLMFFHIMALLR